MLALTRKEMESLTITHAGERLVLKIVKIKGGSVAVSIDAPESFRVWRSELPSANK